MIIDTEIMVVALKGLIVNENKILIVKRTIDDEIGGGTWECPGGKIEFGEDLENALIREIKEEVGLTVEVGRLLYATTFKTDIQRQVILLTYLCSCHSINITLSNEHIDYRWATKGEIRSLLDEEILQDFYNNNVLELEELK